MEDTPCITVDKKKLKTPMDVLNLLRLAMWIGRECQDKVDIMTEKTQGVPHRWITVDDE